MQCNFHQKYFQQYNTILTRNPLHIPLKPPMSGLGYIAVSMWNTMQRHFNVQLLPKTLSQNKSINTIQFYRKTSNFCKCIGISTDALSTMHCKSYQKYFHQSNAKAAINKIFSLNMLPHMHCNKSNVLNSFQFHALM